MIDPLHHKMKQVSLIFDYPIQFIRNFEGIYYIAIILQIIITHTKLNNAENVRYLIIMKIYIKIAS